MTMAQTVVGLYDNYDEAQSVVNALINAGFDRNQISLVVNNADNRFRSGDGGASDPSHSTGVAGHSAAGAVGGLLAGAGEGAVIGGLTGLAASIAMLLIPGVGPILALGPLAATLTGIGYGAVGGGILGGLTGQGIPKDDAGYYAEGVRRGGSLVSAHVDDGRAQEAQSILNRFNPVNIDERGSYYRSTGYNGYDDQAPAFTAEEIANERQRYSQSRMTDAASSADMGTNAGTSGGSYARLHPFSINRDTIADSPTGGRAMTADLNDDDESSLTESRGSLGAGSGI
jgi:hypothetical protein